LVNYVDLVAEGIRRRIPAASLPEGDIGTLMRLYALLALAKGPGVSSEDVHDAWSVWMTIQGEGHESLVPFDQLPRDVRRLDDVYVEAIRAVASELPDGTRASRP
jgi:hypothetical protein